METTTVRFQEISASDILIPDGRFGAEQRNDEIAKMIASVQQFGILEPIIITDEKVLIAGYRRLMAARAAGIELVPVRLQGTLSELDHRRIELEENIMRLDLEWADEAKAIAEIDRLKKIEDPTWTTDKTAELAGVSRRKAYDSISLDKAIKEDPTIAESKTLVGALKEFQKKQHFEKRKKVAELKEKGLLTKRAAIIVQGDCAELIKDIEDESIDAIVTNPPFGIDLEIGKEHKEVYKDDEDYITDLIVRMTYEWYRVLKPDSWCVSFFDIRKITYNKYVKKLVGESKDPLAHRALGLAGWMENAGFSWVSVMPLIWAKPNKTQGTIGNPNRGFISSYEALVFASKGDAKLVYQGLQNIFIYDTPPDAERVHRLQMPRDLCEKLVSLVAIGGELVLDTFAGSGAIGLGALANQCNFVGFELDEELAKRGNTLLIESI